MRNSGALRVSVLGYGAIGSRVAQVLASNQFPDIEFVSVVTRTREPAIADGFRVTDLDLAVRESDLIVEAAGVAAVTKLGPTIISGGCDLLLSSIGALADADLRTRLIAPGPGRCLLSTGAIGGLDLLTAASRDGGLRTATLTSRKRADTLLQPWMSADDKSQLRSTTSSFTLFEGGVHAAISRFPASLNVGVALAAATGLWDATQIRLIADPEADLTTHEIKASGPSGRYEFSITNEPIASNPTSSAVVSQALVTAVAKLVRPSGSFF